LTFGDFTDADAGGAPVAQHGSQLAPPLVAMSQGVLPGGQAQGLLPPGQVVPGMIPTVGVAGLLSLPQFRKNLSQPPYARVISTFYHAPCTFRVAHSMIFMKVVKEPVLCCVLQSVCPEVFSLTWYLRSEAIFILALFSLWHCLQ
jgi:hypothetical protein